MGKRLITQKRGRGSSTYRTKPRSFKPKIEYKRVGGKVTNIVNDIMRNAPLVEVKYDDNSIGYLIAPEGVKVGDNIGQFVVPIKDINEGERVFSIETYPNSGPKLCNAPGSASILVSKTGKNVLIKLPSKKVKNVSLNCRAMKGLPAGDGFKEKPIIKAGKKFHMMRARSKMYPRVSGKAMNAVDHPHGGSGHGKARKPVSRHTPPGRKVGTISPKRTGKRR